MKRNLFAIAVVSILFTACEKSDAPFTGASELSASELKAKPKGTTEPINFTASGPFTGIFPEGMVYDPFNDRFLVSSIPTGNVGAVTRQGNYSTFITNTDPMVATAGMEIDKAHKRLLVTKATGAGTVAQLAIHDLNSGTQLHISDLHALAGGGAHLANDVAIDNQGNAYVTDSYAGNIYKVDMNGNATIFAQSPILDPITPGAFGLNGIEYSSSQGGYLLVGNTSKAQIFKIPINNPASITPVVFTPAITSPDGLLLSKNNKELIVVNNSGGYPGPNNVISYETTNNWATATATTPAFNTGNVYPTTLTSDGKTEYVLYSYLHLLFGVQPDPPTNPLWSNYTIQPLPFNSNHPF